MEDQNPPTDKDGAAGRLRRLLRPSWIVALGGVLICVAVVWFVDRETFEERYEFDLVNLRMRYCTASLFRESCGEPVEHPTARRLRQLEVLPPVSEEDAQWELIKGFKHSKWLIIVRGWHGPGRDYIRGLGASSWLTPVPLPVEEELSQNPWIRWVENDPAGVRQFWREQRQIAASDPHLAGLRMKILGGSFERLSDKLTLEIVNAELAHWLTEFGVNDSSQPAIQHSLQSN